MISKEQLKSEIDEVEDNQLLDKIHHLIRNSQQEHNAAPGSLMAKLLSVQISAPSDFAENIDAYLNGEKSV